MKRLKYLGIFVFVVVGLMLFSGVASAIEIDDCCNVYSPGFWKNHDWPEGVESIQIGEYSYNQAEGQAIMSLPVKGDKRLTLFKALMAAKLNDANNDGPPECCVSSELIPTANAWFEVPDRSIPVPTELPLGKHYRPGGTAVLASSPDWQDCECGCEGPNCGGESLYLQLEKYNDGDLCID